VARAHRAIGAHGSGEPAQELARPRRCDSKARRGARSAYSISQKDRDSAAFHVVAGWLARAEGNFAEQEGQFAAAVKEEPNNDLYQFNLAGTANSVE